MSFIPAYILIIFTTIIVDFFAALKIEKSKELERKVYLIISVIVTLSILFVFKYYYFFDQLASVLFSNFGINYTDSSLSIILPIGLSFHTFQSLSYIIEVYRGNQNAERHFGIYSTYILFYPQLVAGPIERPQNLLHQFRENKVFNYENLIDGLRLMLFGFFIKMVIADNLAPFVDEIYSNPTIYSSNSIWLGLFFYSFQIYCDFFGYSTIALGCAKVLGFDLMNNFKTPYLAYNLKVFWQRWHISLSSWFKDYVYIPLKGSRVRFSRFCMNIFLVFLLSGLWHGASMGFVLWGIFHGIFYKIEEVISRKISMNTLNNKFNLLLKPVLILVNFVLVSLLWVLFRAENLDITFNIYKGLFVNDYLKDNLNIRPELWFFLSLFIVFELILKGKRFDEWCNQLNFLSRWFVYIIISFLIIGFSGVTNHPFIYFQF